VDCLELLKDVWRGCPVGIEFTAIYLQSLASDVNNLLTFVTLPSILNPPFTITELRTDKPTVDRQFRDPHRSMWESDVASIISTMSLLIDTEPTAAATNGCRNATDRSFVEQSLQWNSSVPWPSQDTTKILTRDFFQLSRGVMVRAEHSLFIYCYGRPNK